MKRGLGWGVETGVWREDEVVDVESGWKSMFSIFGASGMGLFVLFVESK